jgi:hypothetical protein
MPRHDYFERLNSLAVIGDLSPAQMAELNAHLAGCPECRGSRAELCTLANDFLTIEDRNSLRAAPDEDAQLPLVRDRVISSAKEQGLRISNEAMLGSHSLLERSMDYVRRARWEFRQWLPRAAVTACIAALVAAAGLLGEKLTDARNELNDFKIHAVRAENETVELNSRLQQVAQAKDTTGAQLLRSETELSAARRHADELNVDLQNVRETLQDLQQQVASLKVEDAAVIGHSAAQERALAASQVQVQKIQAHASAIEADLVTQQYQIKDLVGQLDTQRLNAERERDLTAADHEIRDLMGARDLHMIDVRDVDLRGNWKQPYGRIFLTDNKQLIFYAFDLNKAGHDKLFQVWGQRFDNESSIVSLGTFHLDDQKQSRWIMKVTNPQLLSSIDSVFVTIENSAAGKRPTGKPLMNAYLRNPLNHP